MQVYAYCNMCLAWQTIAQAVAKKLHTSWHEVYGSYKWNMCVGISLCLLVLEVTKDVFLAHCP